MGDHFTFPRRMPRDEARAILADAYAKVNGGKVVRRTLKRARGDGYDPPFDVGFVAEPDVVEYEDGLGVSLNSDILLYEEFPGWQACLSIFEQEVGAALMRHVERRAAKWAKKDRPKG